MRYHAVIFDLFGTLIDGFSVSDYERMVAEMAALVSAPLDEFARLWQATYDGRAVGLFGSGEDCVEHVCRELGIAPSREQIIATARVRTEVTRATLVPREGAVETLARLKSLGYRTGLISDCAIDVPRLWPTTPLSAAIDVPIFSCLVGLKKPDRRIYQLACEQLGVPAERCVYVGDGGSRELSGAAALGMTAVLIRTPRDDASDPHRVDAEDWDGRRVASLGDVLALVQV